MGPSCRYDHCRRLRFIWKLSVAIALAALSCSLAGAQDVKLSVTYVCNGERIYVESCNIRDLSDTATCMVAHPDRPLHNGIMAYTSETRGALKKLFPTCKQPTAQEVAAADAFKKKQQAAYDAAVAKAAGPAPTAKGAPMATAAGSAAQVAPPKTPEERAIRRCVSSGRLPATCTGNSLLGAFSQMISQVLPSGETSAKAPLAGPTMAGVFEGAGKWRIDFIDGGVLVNCSVLSPNQESYTFDFKNNRADLIINTSPKPLVLTVKGDGTIVGSGPGPVTIDGVIASGYKSDVPSNATQKDQYGNLYDSAGNRVSGTANAGHTVFTPKRVTCPAINLTSKGAGVGIQTMQTDLLKSIFSDGDKGPPTPAGIRMQGIFADQSGFSAQFFPESVILGCGPDAARAYPYTVVADGAKAYIKIDSPDHPLTLGFRADGSLDAGTGPYQVHGRIVTGQNDDGDFTFVPMEQTCSLGVLTASKQIPSSGGTTAMMNASNGGGGAPANGGGGLSTPQAPLGNAALSIVSGLPTQAGAANALAGRPFLLLRDSYANTLAKAGVQVPQGTSPYKYVNTVCASRAPDCQKSTDAVKASAISAARADSAGKGILPGVPPGTYYLMISAIYNQQSFVWGQAVQLKAGMNSVTLDLRNATPNN